MRSRSTPSSTRWASTPARRTWPTPRTRPGIPASRTTRPSEDGTTGRHLHRAVRGAHDRPWPRRYAMFATGGTRTRPHFVAKVVDSDGQVRLPGTDDPAKQVIDPKVANDVTYSMKPTSRPPRSTRWPTAAVAAKTGTAAAPGHRQNNDAWMVGYTPKVSTAVWVGTDKPQAMNRAGQPGLRADVARAGSWQKFMDRYLSRHAGRPVHRRGRGQPGAPTGAAESPRRRRRRRRSRRSRARPDTSSRPPRATGRPARRRPTRRSPPSPGASRRRPTAPDPRRPARRPPRRRCHPTPRVIAAAAGDSGRPRRDPGAAAGPAAPRSSRARWTRRRTGRPPFVPSRDDPVVRVASGAIGGPWGRHARSAYPVLDAAAGAARAVTLALGWLEKSPCLSSRRPGLRSTGATPVHPLLLLRRHPALLHREPRQGAVPYRDTGCRSRHVPDQAV